MKRTTNMSYKVIRLEVKNCPTFELYFLLKAIGDQT